MKNVIIRVVANPNSNKTWIIYPNGMKPFVIDKSRCKGAKFKARKIYVADLKQPPVRDTTFVYAVYNHGELLLDTGSLTQAKKKGK